MLETARLVVAVVIAVAAVGCLAWPALFEWVWALCLRLVGLSTAFLPAVALSLFYLSSFGNYKA